MEWLTLIKERGRVRNGYQLKRGGRRFRRRGNKRERERETRERGEHEV